MKCKQTALIALLLVAVAGVARAQDGDDTAMAKQHYKLGLDAYKAGKYPEAIKELKKAYLLKRLPALLLNIGATYRKMGDPDNAIYYYKKYLAEPDVKDKAEVEKTVAELEKEKSGGGGAPAAAAAAEPTPEAAAPPPSGPRTTEEWKHTPVDAAPPGQPLDVRVAMPVSKGVKVYVYYRGAGEADFTQVLMRRHGSEKVGRIPAEALNGKSVQYYIEGKDDKGNVVKSFGSAADPNIVRLDTSAAPQMVAGGEAAEPKGAAHGELDDEAAPIMGEVAEKNAKSKKHASSSSGGGSGGKRFGALFFVGAAFAVAGIAGVAVGSYGLYQAKSYSDVLTTDSNYKDPTTGQPYKFTDPAAQPYDDKTVEARGKFYNNLGIAMTVVGGVALVGGASLMIVDARRHRSERPKTSAWIVPALGPTMAGLAGGATF